MGGNKAWRFEWSDAENHWTMEEGYCNGIIEDPETTYLQKVVSEHKIISALEHTETVTVKQVTANGDVVIRETEETYFLFPWGEELIKLVDNPSGTALTEQWFYYDDEANDAEDVGHLKLHVTDSGYWEWYNYDTDGQLEEKVTQRDDDAYTLAPSETSNILTTYIQASGSYEYAPQIYKNGVLETTVIKDSNVIKSKSYRMRWSDLVEKGGVDCEEVWTISGASADTTADWNDSDNLVSKTWRIAEGEPNAHRIKQALSRDGQMSIYSYPDAGRTVVERGFPNDATVADPEVIYGSRTTIVVGSEGKVVSTNVEQREGSSSSWFDVSLTKIFEDEYDPDIDITSYYYGTEIENELITPGSGIAAYTTQIKRGCCGVLWRRDRKGITTYYEYDALGRLIETKQEYDTSTDSTAFAGTKTIYDVVSGGGRKEIIQRYMMADPPNINPSNSEWKTTKTTYYDLKDRILRVVDAKGISTFFTYAKISNGNDIYYENRVYPHNNTSGPIQVTKTDRHGRVYQSYTASTEDSWSTSTGPDGDETLTKLSLTEYVYDWAGRQEYVRAYYDIDSGLYYETHYEYDTLGRRYRTTDALDNVSETQYDGQGRTISRWQGITTDLMNLKKVSETWYDEDYSRDGNDYRPYPTRVVRVNATDAESLVYTTTNFSQTNTQGIVVSWTKPEVGPWSRQETDNQGRTKYSDLYTNGGATLLSRTENVYDTSTGQLTETHVYAVDAGGNLGNALKTLYTYDLPGRQVKTERIGGGFTKTAYDSLGRIARTVSGSDEGTGTTPVATSGDYAGLTDFTNDIILSETEYKYDAVDNILKMTTYVRNDNADENVTGLLSDHTEYARITYIVSWYDNAHRPEYVVNYGTNDGTALADYFPYTDALEDTLVDAPSLPGTSGGPIINKMVYDPAGRIGMIMDIINTKTKYFYDGLDRQTYVVDNFVNFDPTDETTAGGGSTDEEDRVTKYVYNLDLHIIEQTALMGSGTTDDQTTTYVYGGQSDLVKRTNLLKEIICPDSAGSGTGDTVTMTYYPDGSLHTRTDQRAVEIEYSYDAAGRRTSQEVDAGAGTVEGDQYISYSYTSAGQLDLVTTYSDSGTTVTSQIDNNYNNLGQVAEEFQQHGGIVTSESPVIVYDYDDTSVGGFFTNASRLESVTYPNGRQVFRIYDGHDGIDDAISRANALANDVTGTSRIVDYNYLGSGGMVRKSYPTPAVRLDYIDETNEGTANDPYELSLDKFGRVIRHQWEDYDEYDEGAGDRFKILHAYDVAGNHRYADRQVYKSHSQVYGYDDLHRLVDYKAGKLINNTSGDDVIADYWTLNGRGYTLDQLGNQLSVDTPEATDYYKHNIEDGKANEYTSREVRSTLGAASFFDTFNTDTVNGTDPAWEIVGADVYQVTGGDLKVTTITEETGVNDPGACAVLLKGEAIGPLRSSFRIVFPTSAISGDQAGIVFGYTSPGNYWIYVAEFGTNQVKLIQVVEGEKQTEQAVQGVSTITAGVMKQYFLSSKRNSANIEWSTDFEFTDGFPAGKYGVWTNCEDVEFELVSFSKSAPATELAGHWLNLGSWVVVDAGSGDDRLQITSTVPNTTEPLLLDGVRADRFEATFKMNRTTTSDTIGCFVFGASDYDDYLSIRITHSATGGVAPIVHKVVDGHNKTLVTADSTYPANVPARQQSEDLWVRITSDGSTLTIRCSTDEDFDNDNDCYTTSTANVDLTRPGGMFGFMAASFPVQFDNLTIKSDHDNDGYYTVTECEDNFDINSIYVVQDLDYDAAGNLIYDGMHQFTYDAWNRLVKVENAYPDDSASAGYSPGSVIATMDYDALGRRITKAITNSTYLNTTYHYYLDGQSVIQIDNYSNQMLKQYVWGLQYIDELCQIGINQDPKNADEENNHLLGSEENECEFYYYAILDANFNVLGLINHTGRLVERYEYTPYGQRTVYSHPIFRGDVNGDGYVGLDDMDAILANINTNPQGPHPADLNGDGYISSYDLDVVLAMWNSGYTTSTDPDITYPTLISARFTSNGSSSGIGPALCEVGHQGLFHDEEFGAQGGLIYNRARTLYPRMGRFMQRDPLGYVDGMNMYASYYALGSQLDPYGLDTDPRGADGGCCGLDITDHMRQVDKVLKGEWDRLKEPARARLCQELFPTIPFNAKDIATFNLTIEKLMDAPQPLWDLQELAFNKEYFISENCGTDNCAIITDPDNKTDKLGTVQVNGECHRPAEVNYYLWGAINRLCNKADYRIERSVHLVRPAAWLLYQRGYIDKEFYDKAKVYIDEAGYMGNVVAPYKLEFIQESVRVHRKLRKNGAGIDGRIAWTNAGWYSDFSKASAVKLEACTKCDEKYDGIIHLRIGQTYHTVDFNGSTVPAYIRAEIHPPAEE